MRTAHPDVSRGLLSVVEDKAYHTWCAAEVYAGWIEKAMPTILRHAEAGGSWYELEGSLVRLSKKMLNRHETCAKCGQELANA